MDNLVKRVERLERTNRALIAGMLTLCGVLLMGAVQQRKVPEVIEAQEFRVVHADSGLAMGAFGYLEGIPGLAEGLTRLSVGGFGGRVTISAGTSHPSIAVRAAGVVLPVIELGITDDGPKIELSDLDANLRAVLGTAAIKGALTGETRTLAASSLVLFDKEGHVIYRAPPGR